MKYINVIPSVLLLSVINQPVYAIEKLNFRNIDIYPYARVVGGVSYTNNLFESGIQGDKTEVAGNQWGTSFFGMTTNIELENYWKGFANLESGFDINNGNINDDDSFFDRKANVGLMNDLYGSLSFGTHLSLNQDIESFDPMGFQTYGLNSLSNGINDGSSKNSILYISPSIYNLTLSYQHQFGGYVGDNERGIAKRLSANYQLEKFGFQAIYSDQKDSNGRYTGSDYYGLGSQEKWEYAKTWTIASNYSSDDYELFAGYINVKSPDAGFGREAEFDDKAHIFWSGINYNLTKKLELLGGYYQSKQSASNKKSKMYTVGANYNWSDNIMLFMTAGYINNNTISSDLHEYVGQNSHALDYSNVACDSEDSCDGSSQFGTYAGLVVKI